MNNNIYLGQVNPKIIFQMLSNFFRIEVVLVTESKNRCHWICTLGLKSVQLKGRIVSKERLQLVRVGTRACSGPLDIRKAGPYLWTLCGWWWAGGWMIIGENVFSPHLTQEKKIHWRRHHWRRLPRMCRHLSEPFVQRCLEGCCWKW